LRPNNVPSIEVSVNRTSADAGQGPAFISDVSPRVEPTSGPSEAGVAGPHAVKRIVGDTLVVEADIFRDGHALLRAQARLLVPGKPAVEVPMLALPVTSAHAQDRWRAELALDTVGLCTFELEAWTDHYGSWLRDLGKKVAAKKDVKLDRQEGTELITKTAEAAPGPDAEGLRRYAALLQLAPDDAAALVIAGEQALVDLMLARAPRKDLVRSAAHPVYVDRERAAFSAWYELFPRSQGDGGKHGTFATAAKRLHEIADLGFDILYLPPIHPIGQVNRKGRNNSLNAGPTDPGSPWAIGSAAGGHTAIEPKLGTLDDFDVFVKTANRLGLEIALDFAIQCAPDHPWVRQHPDWFFHRPDGSIKYAENPPKEYQDVYPIDFDTKDRENLIKALGDVMRFWVARGVTVFRVDNPHTKPIYVWERLIAEIQQQNPNVLFLAEAFTRPKMMKALGKVGFSQSYTYFTWRTTKAELTEYVTELSGEMSDYYRPSFWPNTPDILPKIIQNAPAAAFKQRLLLAATLSPSYGIYSGYELCEGAPLHGEEYLDSEKYELKQRDFDAPGNIKAYIARINQIRRDNPALHRIAPVEFLWIDSEDMLFFCKANEDRTNILLVVVNLDPAKENHARVHVPPATVGVKAGERYQVTDLLTGARYDWGEDNFVMLDPSREPAHIFKVEKRTP
jgi:starch synthase (maltosyl-transferring)